MSNKWASIKIFRHIFIPNVLSRTFSRLNKLVKIDGGAQNAVTAAEVASSTAWPHRVRFRVCAMAKCKCGGDIETQDASGDTVCTSCGEVFAVRLAACFSPPAAMCVSNQSHTPLMFTSPARWSPRRCAPGTPPVLVCAGKCHRVGGGVSGKRRFQVCRRVCFPPRLAVCR